MKTILNKVDPKYLDCVSGLCEHTSHQFNLFYLIAIPLCVIAFIVLKKVKS